MAATAADGVIGMNQRVLTKINEAQDQMDAGDLDAARGLLQALRENHRLSGYESAHVLNLLGYAAGYVAGTGMRVTGAMRRALTLEIGMQNAGVWTVLAVTYFPAHPHAAILPAAYTFGCMLTGTLLARAWAIASERQQRREAAAATAGESARTAPSVAASG